MAKPLAKETVALRGSRIRRDPVRLDKIEPPSPPSPEREVRTAVIGVALIAAAGAALVVGFSEVTSHRRAAAAPVARFLHCHTGGGPDCVVDGDSIRVAGQPVELAGIDAPEVFGAACREESRRGIQAAVRLRELLNGGPVTLAVADRASTRTVEVNGADAGAVLVAEGLARSAAGGARSWC